MYTEQQIRKMIDEYKPSNETVEILDNDGLVVFVGVTGAGKNTIMSHLVDTGKYHDAITSTTRLPRENNGVMEVEGVDYFFLTTEQAVGKLQAGEYAEVSWVHNRINGMLAVELARSAALNKTTITDIDIQGAFKCRALSSNVTLFFVVPPSFNEWDQRNRSRYQTPEDFLAAWPDRKASAINELRLALASSYFEFIVNDDINNAVAKVRAYLENGEAIGHDNHGRQAAQHLLEELENS